MKPTGPSISRLSLKPLLIFISLVLGFPSLASAENAAREIYVTAAVSKVFKKNPDWQTDIRSRIIFANQIFEKQFGIHFSVNRFVNWEPQDEKREMSLLIEELKSQEALGPNQIVVGFHRMSQAFGQNAMEDMEAVGTAEFFRGYVIIRDPAGEMKPEDYLVVLTHEFAHLFGGVHVAEMNQIMRSSVPEKVDLTIDPQNADVIRATRQVDFQKGLDSLTPTAIESLIRIYEQLIRKNPHSDFYYQLGNFYRKQGQMARAVAVWEESIRYQHANPFIHRELGFFYFRGGRYELAIQELGVAVAHFILPSQQKQKAETFNALGIAYFQKGNKEQALINWLKGLTADPDNADLQGNLAALYMDNGDVDHAISELLKLGVKYPKEATTWNNLGIAYLRKKDYAKAEEFFVKALQNISSGPAESANPEDRLFRSISAAEVKLNLGAVYVELGKSDRALEELVKAQALNPQLPGIHHNLARIYLEKKQYPKALAETQAALKETPEDASLFGILGGTYEGMGKPQEALQSARKAIGLSRDPKFKAIFYRNVGFLYARQGKMMEASIEFKNSLNQNWNDPDTHTHLGFAYLQMGKREDAKRSFQTAVKMDPKNAEAQKALMQLSANGKS